MTSKLVAFAKRFRLALIVLTIITPLVILDYTPLPDWLGWVYVALLTVVVFILIGTGRNEWLTRR